jgi:DNA-binding CsgD family transcriptional regulator
MKEIDFQYLLVNKINQDEIRNYAAILIEKNQDIDAEQKQQLSEFVSAFIDFVTTQIKQTRIDEKQLNHWVQMFSNDMPVSKSHIFLEILSESFKNVLDQQEQPYRKELLDFHKNLLHKVTAFYLNWVENPPEILERKHQYMQRLDRFSEILIQKNGTEDLPYLLARVEEIFGFRRCVFVSYNPWLKEFSGVIGEELSKVQLLRGKIESEPVFALKRPLFLKEPDPYVQQVAIEMFELSSIIFIPITHEHQLFGWLTFDQRGESFDCTKLELDILEKVGERLGMYLARKQMGRRYKYPLDLTEKELAILHLLTEGYSNKEMATFMFLSEFTVRDYIQKLMIKLRAKNRTQLITMAFRMGLVD